MEVYFVVKDIEGTTHTSNLLLGKMVSEVLNSHNVITKVTNNFINLKNSILVFTGSLIKEYNLTPQLISRLKENNNKLILNPVDYLVWAPQEELNLYPLLDGFIFPNKKYIEMLPFTGDKAIAIIPHHFDTRIKQFPQLKSKELNIGYFGSPYQDKYLQSPPPELDVYFNLQIEELNIKTQEYNVHFSHRSPKLKDFYLKPATKLAIASISNSAFLTSKDYSVIEYLPDDYPLFVDENNFNEKFELIKSKFNTPEWGDYVGFISNLKNKFDLNYQVVDYNQLFNQLK